jgi:hypothetical protein
MPRLKPQSSCEVRHRVTRHRVTHLVGDRHRSEKDEEDSEDCGKGDYDTFIEGAGRVCR